MQTILRKSLMGKVVVFCLFVALVPAALVGYLSFRRAGTALEEAQLEKLGAARDLAAKNVVDYLLATVTDMTFLAANESVHEAFEILSFYATASESKNTAVQLEIDTDKYQRIVEKIDPLFKRWIALYEPTEAHHDLLAVVGRERERLQAIRRIVPQLVERLHRRLVRLELLIGLAVGDARRLHVDEREAGIAYAFFDQLGQLRHVRAVLLLAGARAHARDRAAGLSCKALVMRPPHIHVRMRRGLHLVVRIG